MGFATLPARDQIIEREAIVFGRQQQNKKEQGQTGNYVFVKRIERFVQEMAEGYDYENEAECDQGFASAQTKNQQGAGNQFDERDRYPGRPERPDRKKRVGKGKKILAGMIERA